MARYCTTILLGAFLLFQVQPQIARTILPWFGGGAAVWSTCMLFFQVLLLGGYGYAHLLHRRLTPGRQAVVHAGLLAISFYFLPVTPAAHWQPTGTENPSVHILLLLTATVGMPYLLLSATGPLLQSWFAREFDGRSPYRLYALSNVGSLAALLSFPFLFEPNLSGGVQSGAWSVAYVAFACLSGFCAYTTSRAATATDASRDRSHERSAAGDPAADEPLRSPGEPWSAEWPSAVSGDEPASWCGGGVAVATPTAAATATAVAAAPSVAADTPIAAPVLAPAAAQKLRWVALAMLPSVMLLAVTNAICQDIAVMPFFWVMPLSVYLLTFILTFDSDRWYRRQLIAPLLGSTALALFVIPPTWFVDSLAPQVTLLCGALFCCGMLCHGELARSRPRAEHLTGFYLFVSLGGALGGVFVAVVAPLCFSTYFEVELALVGCLVASVYAGFKYAGQGAMRSALRFGLGSALAVGLGIGVVVRVHDAPEFLERSRNFFGTLNVQSETRLVPHGGGLDRQTVVSLTHGSIVHGRQVFGSAVKVGQGMTYYSPGSGIAHALTNHPATARGPLRVGLIGLGTGTLAHYARDGDHYTYFEINPDVERVAEQHFTYMRDARSRGATVDVTIGDARIQLERDFDANGSRDFDVLVVDAFNSDAIPMHLLTRECGAVYWQHLAADGILAVHVSNRHLDLAPVVRGLARDAHRQMRHIRTQPQDLQGANASDWILVTNNAEYLSRDELRISPDAAANAPASLLWTDDFSSLWHVLK